MKNKSTPAQKELPIQTYNRLLQIFSRKGWPRNSVVGTGYFDRFCELLKELSDEEQEMLLTLTEDFVWVQEMEYIGYFYPAFDRFIRSLPSEPRRTIVIAPLLPEADFGKSKSSVIFFYMIKSHMPEIQAEYRAQSILHNITMQDNLANFDPAFFPEGSLFCLVDDFIGSGETAVSAIQFFLDRGISAEQLAVLSLVVLQQGIDYLSQNQIRVLSGLVMGKAITDRTDGNAEYYRELMQGIETRIKVKPDNTFGYAHSEGLVRMVRTPNNTFPIYWFKNKKNPNAPFPR